MPLLCEKPLSFFLPDCAQLLMHEWRWELVCVSFKQARLDLERIYAFFSNKTRTSSNHSFYVAPCSKGNCWKSNMFSQTINICPKCSLKQMLSKCCLWKNACDRISNFYKLAISDVMLVFLLSRPKAGVFQMLNMWILVVAKYVL